MRSVNDYVQEVLGGAHLPAPQNLDKTGGALGCREVHFAYMRCWEMRTSTHPSAPLLIEGRPIFSLNHSGASATMVFTIPTTLEMAHARCYTRAERATQSATRIGSSLLDARTVPSTQYVPKLVFAFSPICRACTNSTTVNLIIMKDLI